MGGGEREKIQEKKKKTIETSQGLSPWVLGRLVGRAFVCVCFCVCFVFSGNGAEGEADTQSHSPSILSRYSFIRICCIALSSVLVHYCCTKLAVYPSINVYIRSRHVILAHVQP